MIEAIQSDAARAFPRFSSLSAQTPLPHAPGLGEEPRKAFLMPETWAPPWHVPGRLIAMPRIIWLALISLLFLSALFALRTSIGARAIVESTNALPPPAVDDEPPLAKSDRLPALDLNRTETSVRTVKIAPTQPEAKASPKTIDGAGERMEVTSWHWHAGSKTIKRTTSQLKSGRER